MDLVLLRQSQGMSPGENYFCQDFLRSNEVMETGGTQLARSSLVPCCESAAPFSSCGGPGLLSAAVFLCLLFFHRADCAFRGCSVMTARIRSLTPASPWLANAHSPGRCRGQHPQMDPCPFALWGRVWGVFPLVIATVLVSVLCFCMFLLKPHKAKCFCAGHKLLFVSF